MSGSDSKSDESSSSLLGSLMKLTGQVAGNTLDIARNTATMTAMFGENWLRGALLNSLEPERLEAMAEAGHFLRDARETAGLSLKELGESLGLSDNSVLEDVESGDSIMPLELMLRSAALLARHDPIPFLIKFMRTYNPALEKRLEQWGVLSLPKHFERERRFINIYRQHDALRALSDEEHERFVKYMNSSTELVLDVMLSEKLANNPGDAKPENKTKAKTTATATATAKKKARPKAKATSRKRKPTAKKTSRSTGSTSK
ncbi:MAG: helix-turn-helix transcriptional regulator [Proteobacteria bacterium]|nr:helix-turn-helix transcriptional regulator [Pseudomonadota bacterium]